MTENIKVGLISLGCDKNRVDGEKLLAEVGKKYQITSDADEADVLIVNTCAFLNASRKEAIETAIEYADKKRTARLKKLIMTGCLPQGFIDSLFDEFTEVDGFLGTFDGDRINEAIERTLSGERVNLVGKGKTPDCERVQTTPAHYAYLKIADGCDNHCTYCLIPKIRGRYVSTPIDALIEEARMLGDVKELILVAQDVTRYGFDLYGEYKLVELIKSLTALDNIKSVRLLYCYPELIDNGLIDELSTNPKLIKYVDIPLQHASDRILKLMNRSGTYKSYLELIRTLRARVKGIAIRSTFIAGFPSETEEDFATLVDFLKKAKLTNAGFFAYSKEPDTPAFKMKGHIPERLKKERVKTLYAVQKSIVDERLKKLVGKKIKVICDGVDYKAQSFYGRAMTDAPEVDGKVFFTGDVCIDQGAYYTVRITAVKGYDLIGTVVV